MQLPSELGHPFPGRLIKTHQKGGRSFSYVSVAHYIDRLNKALGDAWSWEILHTNIEENFVVVLGRLHVGDSYRDGFGGALIQRYSGGKSEGQPIELGDTYKSAASDALKKAASHYGVGLTMHGAEDPTDEVRWALSEMEADERKAFGEAWKEAGLPRVEDMGYEDALLALDLLAGWEWSPAESVEEG